MSVIIRFKKLANGKKSVYLDIYHEGERAYEFLDIHIHKNDPLKKSKMKLAEQIRSVREVDIYHSNHSILHEKRKNLDFIEYYQDFIANYHGKDVRLVLYSLKKFKLMIGREKFPISSLTKKICSDFARFLNNPSTGLSGETPYNYWMKFKRVLKEAVLDGILMDNPSTEIVVRRKTNQLKKNVLSADELRSLANTPCEKNPEVKRAFLFACYTGLGASELRKLTREHIQNGRIIIYRQKSKEQVINDLHPVAQKLLGDIERLEPLTTLFNLPSDVTVLLILKSWVRKAGIRKKISFYCGRHTFATQLLLNGANLKTVADCLAHSTTYHTLKYLNYVDSLKSDAINKLPNIECWKDDYETKS